jgi:hypothetical protein
LWVAEVVVHMADWQRNPELPFDLDAVCMKCLDRRTENRYSSFPDLADALAPPLVGQPALVRPAPGRNAP